MLKTIIVLPDGTELSSGTSNGNAIQSCTYTECVNAGTELTLGSVCASMVEVKLITPEGGLQIAAGDALTLYKDDGNARRKLGIFIAEKPARPSAHTMKLTAYDRITLLDKDLTGWLAALTDWPCSLYDLAAMVCNECGLELVNTGIPNGSYLVQKFSAEGITGRKLMQWIGQAAGRFCRATADGKVEFAWYEPAAGHSIGTTEKTELIPIDFAYDEGTQTLTVIDPDMTVTGEKGTVTVASDRFTVSDDGKGTVTLSAGERKQHFFFQGGLTFEDYVIAPIEKVQIHANEEDVGVVWPNDTEAVNTYRITGNLLLSNEQVEVLQPVAQTLYEQLKTAAYTPCQVSIPATPDIRAGHILSITDRNGKTITAWVMTKKQTGQKDTLECTGSFSRDSVSAVNEQSYGALSGKVLNLRTDVEGIKAENKDASGRLASLKLALDGISGQVEQQTANGDALRKELTEVRQTANAVKISVQAIQDNGVSKVQTGMGYTFDDSGLHIARQGEQMENRLDNTGMYVTRGGQTVLQANDDGVEAVDIKVRNYLVVGRSRLETYENDRTACFYISGDSLS